MGTTNSQSKFFMKTFEKDYSEFGTEKTVVGDFLLYKNKFDGRLVAKRKYMAKSVEEHEYLVTQQERRTALDHVNLLRVHAFKSKLKGHACTSLNKIDNVIEWSARTLDSELNERYRNSNFLTENDIWLLLWQVSAACKFLRDNQMDAEDIRPALIFLTTNNTVKVADRAALLGYQGSYMCACNANGKVLLAPEQQQALNQKEAFPSYNIAKADVFALGMTLLLAATLYQPDTLYDYPRYKIKFQSLDEALKKAGQLYSHGLVYMIQQLINENPDSRPTFDQIQNFLKPYHEKLKQGEAIDVLQLPNQSQGSIAPLGQYGKSIGEQPPPVGQTPFGQTSIVPIGPTSIAPPSLGFSVAPNYQPQQLASQFPVYQMQQSVPPQMSMIPGSQFPGYKQGPQSSVIAQQLGTHQPLPVVSDSYRPASQFLGHEQ